MSIRTWLARHTSNPSQYANSYASSLMELSGYLAACLVAFSGQRNTDVRPDENRIAFGNHFEMESAGFEPVTKDIASLIAPSVNEMANKSLFNSAYQAATAFLCLHSDNTVRGSMQPKNAAQFSQTLYSSVAKLSAGQFGFKSEPQSVFITIQELRPAFLCERMLNIESFGENDGLGTILNRLRYSPDRQILYSFVVGSPKQSLGCASHFVKVIHEMSTSIERCAHDLQW